MQGLRFLKYSLLNQIKAFQNVLKLMSFDLSKQSRQLTVCNAPVTVSLLICHLYLNDQLLRMSEILALIERKALYFFMALSKELFENFTDIEPI